ncbi:MAG: sulfate transporter [Planctomycetes bacterium]|nr:sulfate transporter [Planctomycetota bacterium]
MSSQPTQSTATHRLRFDLGEASGALGDLGTFVPLVAALVAMCHLDLGSVLLFAGLCNVLSGVLFGQPIPVQPMKAIAAVGIAEAISPGAIAAAGLLAGGIVLLLGITGLVRTVERHIPSPVVRGIQLGVGLKLLIAGIGMIGPMDWTLDGPIVAMVAAAFVLITGRWARFPSALFLFVFGIAMMLFLQPELLGRLELGWDGITPIVPDLDQWRDGFLRGTVPQLPLTLLNSVIAVCALSGDLFPGRSIRVRSMAVSVGLMNVVGCWFGAMPMCHGSGGLAGQHRFGARTGGSVVMLGLAKILLAVTLGSSAVVLLDAYPMSILGILLCFAGVELALPARKATGPDEFFLVVVTAGGCLGFNTAIGFSLGILAALLIGARNRFGAP